VRLTHVSLLQVKNPANSSGAVEVKPSFIKGSLSPRLEDVHPSSASIDDHYGGNSSVRTGDLSTGVIMASGQRTIAIQRYYCERNLDGYFVFKSEASDGHKHGIVFQNDALLHDNLEARECSRGCRLGENTFLLG